MMNKPKWKWAIGIVLVFALMVTACPTTTSDDKDEETDFLNAVQPVITKQPSSIDYLNGAGLAVAPLTVTATVTNGALSYQWHSNTSLGNTDGAVISGATAASYAPSISAAGEYFYYVVVTNDAEVDGKPAKASLASNPVRIRVLDSAPAALSKTITVNTAAKHQYVRGFGGMANVWTSPDMTVKDIETMFNPVTGLGLNILRMCLYPYMDDIIDNIEIPERDNSDWYELIKRVNKHGGYVLASPWTPPKEWKEPQQREGGSHLRPAYYPDYANHLKAFAQRMYDNGAPIYAVSIQNEPNYTASYDGCEWTSDQQRDFFQQVGHFTDGVKGWGGGKEIPTVLTMSGEVANNVSWNNSALNNETASKAIDIVGYHIYGSLETRYANALENQYKPKETWMTEHNLNTPADYVSDYSWEKVWLFIDEVDHCIANNDSSVYVWWYAKRFYSFIGDGDNGTVNGQPLWRGYALSHYSKFAADTTRVELSGNGISGLGNAVSSTVRATAYESMDGNAISLVIYNKGSDAVGEIQVNFPAGFEAANAYGIITDGVKKAANDFVSISYDKKSGLINLPANAIISVRFTK